eukprot:6305727-Prymnesium_polylepis.1
MEEDIGGVWFKNRYPGLRLHAPGYSYRALSLAPQWQKSGEGQNHPEYRPYQSEILAYVQVIRRSRVHPFAPPLARAHLLLRLSCDLGPRGPCARDPIAPAPRLTL